MKGQIGALCMPIETLTRNLCPLFFWNRISRCGCKSGPSISSSWPLYRPWKGGGWFQNGFDFSLHKPRISCSYLVKKRQGWESFRTTSFEGRYSIFLCHFVPAESIRSRVSLMPFPRVRLDVRPAFNGLVRLFFRAYYYFFRPASIEKLS